MMAVQVYGCNHIVIEVTDAKKAVRFYSDVFGLKESPQMANFFSANFPSKCLFILAKSNFFCLSFTFSTA